MAFLWGFTFTHFATPLASHRLTYPICSVGAGKKRIGRLRAKVSGEDDGPWLQRASDYATLRYLETHRPEPLFFDPYVGCLVPPSTKIDGRDWTHHHCIATKFIDDQLLSATRDVDGPKQVVLLTDGMDTRPYRLAWPNSTLIFDISPGKVYEETAQKLKGTEFAIKSSGDGWMDKLFFSHGFRINVIAYEEMARCLGRELPLGDADRIAFSGQYLRFSDAQMEIWRSEFQRVEEEGDEDGFEEL